MTFERMIDRHTDPQEQEFVVTVTAEHSIPVTAESGDAAIEKAKDLMDPMLYDRIVGLDDYPEVELCWTHDEVDQADLYDDYWED